MALEKGRKVAITMLEISKWVWPFSSRRLSNDRSRYCSTSSRSSRRRGTVTLIAFLWLIVASCEASADAMLFSGLPAKYIVNHMLASEQRTACVLNFFRQGTFSGRAECRDTDGFLSQLFDARNIDFNRRNDINEIEISVIKYLIKLRR
jgi:hypothetical protein